MVLWRPHHVITFRDIRKIIDTKALIAGGSTYQHPPKKVNLVVFNPK